MVSYKHVDIRKMKSIKIENAKQYPTLNVDLLGKPIHAIREELKLLLSQASSSVTYQLQRWIKDADISFKLNGIELHRCNTQPHAHPTSIFSHQNHGLLRASLSKSLLLALSDRFYGADIQRSANPDCSVTSSDIRLQQRMGQLIANHIAPEGMWQKTEAAFSNEVGLQASFAIDYGEMRGELLVDLDATLIQILIDELALEPKEPIQDKFTQALAKTPVTLSAVLCRKEMPLDQVVNLQPDDIINIDLLSNVPISIGQEHLFNGRVAEQNGQLVLILKDLKD